MTVTRRIAAAIWRLGLRVRFALLHRHRHDRDADEVIGGIPIHVSPGVFNPALFRVTPVFVGWLSDGLVPPGAVVLDLGTGSGVLAIAAAASASRVTAVDRNAAAVACARDNVAARSLTDRIDVRHGDLFEPVTGERFDLVLVNPPYLPGSPTTELEAAFLVGDFAERFASALPDHLAEGGRALVILSDQGDQGAFLDAFETAGLAAEPIRRRDLVSEIVTLWAVQRSR